MERSVKILAAPDYSLWRSISTQQLYDLLITEHQRVFSIVRTSFHSVCNIKYCQGQIGFYPLSIFVYPYWPFV